jgi:hypothetical protein
MLYTQIAIVALGLIGSAVTVWQADKAQDASDRAALLAQKSERDARATAANQLAESQRQFQLTSKSNSEQFNKTLAQLAAQTTAQGVSAEAAKSAAETAQKTLIAANRAWLTADIRLGSPFTFYKSGDAGFSLGYSLKNTGHAPALNVFALPKLIVPRNPQTEPQVELAKVCEQASKLAANSGLAVFPTGTTKELPGEVGVGANKETISMGQVIPGFISPTVVFCIAYQTTLDSSWHHTGMIMEISKDGTTAIQIGENIPIQHQRIALSIFHGISAD